MADLLPCLGVIPGHGSCVCGVCLFAPCLFLVSKPLCLTLAGQGPDLRLLPDPEPRYRVAYRSAGMEVVICVAAAPVGCCNTHACPSVLCAFGSQQHVTMYLIML